MKTRLTAIWRLLFTKRAIVLTIKDDAHHSHYIGELTLGQAKAVFEHEWSLQYERVENERNQEVLMQEVNEILK